MAHNSPFKILRKYQKPILAVGVALLLLTWLVGDALFSGGPPRGGTGSADDRDEVVQSWDGGEITRGELEKRIVERNLLRNFLTRAYQLTREKVGEEAEFAVVPVVPLGRQEQNVEQAVLQTKILADAARKAGIVVTDQAINNYLKAFVQNAVSTAELNSLVGNGNRQGFSMRNVFDALREELLANTCRASYQYLADSTTPELRYRDWLRVNDEVSVEVIPVTVSSFVDQIDDPTQEQLADFYELYRDRVASPEVLARTRLPASQPGFMEPRRVQVEYLEADFEDFVTKAAAEVTDEEIAEYYQENQENYARPSIGIDPLEPLGDSPNNPFLDPPSADTPPSSEPAEDAADRGSDQRSGDSTRRATRSRRTRRRRARTGQ